MPVGLGNAALGAVLDTVSDLVFVVDDQRRLRWTNATALEHLGWDPDDILGADIIDRIDPDDHGLFNRAWPHLAVGVEMPGRYEVGLLTAGGTLERFDMTIRNLVGDGVVDSVVFLARPVVD